MALKAEIDGDIDLHENSLDNSADSELLGMVDDGSFGSGEDRTQLVSQSFLDTNEEDNTAEGYNFRDLSGSVTYKIVHMSGEETGNSVSSHSPSHSIPSAEYYVIGDALDVPVDVYGTTTTQKKIVRKAPVPSKAITTKKANKPDVTPYYREYKLNTNSVLLQYEMRDDKRRATHNEVERRRRDKINSWITKLAALVPNSGLADSASKGGILAKACDHIADLTAKQKRLEKMEVDNDKLVLEILRLNQELNELRKENNSMRSQLADNCIVVNQRPKGQKS